LKSQVVTVVTPNIMRSLRDRGVFNLMLVPNGADIKTFRPLANRKNDEVFKIIHSGGIYHVWGHSWEIGKRNDWIKLERVLQYISNRDYIKYYTNGEILSRYTTK